MVYRIEVAEYSERSAHRAYQQCADVAFFLRQKRAFLPYQYRRRKYESDKISEKALLDRRQIACQPYESTHKSKAKG